MIDFDKQNLTYFNLFPGLNAKFSPGHSEFLADVRQEKESIGDIPDLNDSAVVIINSSQYSRYRAVLRRIQGSEKYWMHNSLIVSLGGFTTPTRKTHILFCREIFDYAELEEHPYLCNHLGKSIIIYKCIHIFYFPLLQIAILTLILTFRSVTCKVLEVIGENRSMWYHIEGKLCVNKPIFTITVLIGNGFDFLLGIFQS